jgi:hypothetical protein
MTENRTVAGAFDAIEAHEELCALRYKGILDDIGELKDIVKGAGKMLAGLALALLAWGGSQIYSDLKNPRQPVQAAVTVLQTPAR